MTKGSHNQGYGYVNQMRFSYFIKASKGHFGPKNKHVLVLTEINLNLIKLIFILDSTEPLV